MPKPNLFEYYFASVKITTTQENLIYYIVTSGHIPHGLYLDPIRGILLGLPTSPGIYNFTITAMDSRGQIQSQPYQLTVTP